MGLVSSARVGMLRCHANKAISRRIGRVGAEVSKSEKGTKIGQKIGKREQKNPWLLSRLIA